MQCCNAYESESMRDALGETLRPGGFLLTEMGVQTCNISPDDKVLDLGCGRGATVNYLYEKHGICATGIDPSEKLLDEARKQYKFADFYRGSGENLPFEKDSFSCVLAECTLSLMNPDLALKQVNKVLKPNGWFIITDVYAKNPDAIDELNQFAMNSCMRGLHSLPNLSEKLTKENFETVLLEDCSHYLKELLVKITFSYGSMNAFWNAASHNCIDGCDFQNVLKKCRPGYFILIARKAGTNHG